MRLSGISNSIADRLKVLRSKAAVDLNDFYASILDYENSCTPMPANQPIRLEKSVTIEEFADDEGNLTSDSIPEAVFLESLTRETGLDCRMILDFKPFKETGLYTLRVMVAEKGKLVEYVIKLWIVPAP